ncbi:MAG: DUF1206 domain-containing protein [Wenzhouxiangellaceae bacterium]|nr:MAG: DUF1206 domain-containing protein [Wenzhouxiangellaceae bacterium]
MLRKPMFIAGRSMVEILARLGYVAKGLIFLAVGVLALLALFGFAEGRVTGTGGAIHVIGRQMPGRWGFSLLALGLGGHVFWRLYQAFLDPAEKGRSWLALIQRSGFLVSACIYGSMLLVTISALTGLVSNPADSADFADRALSWPGGRFAVGVLGLGVIGVGLYQGWRALFQPFRDKWAAPESIAWVLAPLAWMSSLGIGIRALLFVFLGWAAIRTGWLASSDELADLASTLWRLFSRDQFGGLMLGVTAVGLSLYGVYCLTNAALRRIET